VEILRDLRIKKGLSQNQLAKLSGMSRAAISHIEAGNRLPTLLTCYMLADCMEVELSRVLIAAEGK
jgi:transcriptional regulator with XRE-family HTH domain